MPRCVVSNASELELSGGVKRLFSWEGWGAVGRETLWELGEGALTTPPLALGVHVWDSQREQVKESPEKNDTVILLCD